MKIDIAYQGKPGAYSELALENYSKQINIKTNSISSKDFNDLFEKIDKETYLGFVPIENSNAGSVTQTVDLLAEKNIEIIGEYYLKVNHLLLAKKNTNFKNIKEVYSHPQALQQCSKFLFKNLLTPVSYLDTAGSAEYVSNSSRNDIAAISSSTAAIHYNLKILKDKFQNSNENVTRFFLVKKKGKTFEFEKNLPKPDKTTLIFKTRNIPGALYKCLGAFATNNINLTKLESRPSKKTNFDYIFFVDFQGSLDEERVILALDEINFYAKKLTKLGSYKSFYL